MTDSDSAEAPGQVAVLLPLPLAGAYDYLVPPGLQVAAGDVVVVPFGKTTSLGVAWGPGTGAVAAEKLRPVAGKVECPPLPEETRRFVDKVADYTVSPPGAVARMCFSVSAALQPPSPRIAYRRGPKTPERLTPSRRRVLEIAGEGPVRTMADLAESAGVGTGVIRGLIDAGGLEAVLLPPYDPPARPDWQRAGPVLNQDQVTAAAALRAAVEAGTYSTRVLEGVTGAGKTEVYFEAIAACLAAGKQALVLLPEIALSAQWLSRFEARFGARPMEWHSDLKPFERRRNWRQIVSGEAFVVVGARSALFLPFTGLGLIVVDEEHDGSYKQDDGIRYQARDMAVLRGALGGFPVILSSATPSLETRANVQRGRYSRVVLANRHGSAVLPQMRAVDLRRDPPPRGRWLSPVLTAAVQETLERKEQALLFLNRRGYAPLTLCGACGHRLQCPNCSTWLVEHRLAGRLRCHHCGYEARLPTECPACGAEGRLKPCGPGIERLVEEATGLFPDARIAAFASDLLTGPRQAQAMVEKVLAGEVDLLIGTQILAKGHHFPMLTLVGVVDADLGLGGGDLRAAERTYQLLSQVAGRAGRAEHEGRVLLQTYAPEAPVLRALVSGDVESFIESELEARAQAGMPPYGRLAALIVSGSDLERVVETGKALARSAPQGAEIEVWGPAAAPLSLLRGRHRQRLLVKADRGVRLGEVLRAWVGGIRTRGNTRIDIDVDPYSFL